MWQNKIYFFATTKVSRKRALGSTPLTEALAAQEQQVLTADFLMKRRLISNWL